MRLTDFCFGIGFLLLDRSRIRVSSILSDPSVPIPKIGFSQVKPSYTYMCECVCIYGIFILKIVSKYLPVG